MQFYFTRRNSRNYYPQKYVTLIKQARENESISGTDASVHTMKLWSTAEGERVHRTHCASGLFVYKAE